MLQSRNSKEDSAIHIGHTFGSTTRKGPTCVEPSANKLLEITYFSGAGISGRPHRQLTRAVIASTDGSNL